MAGFLAARFPGDYYGSDFAKSMDFLGYLANQRQREEAFKNQQINRDMALEDLFHTQQMNPLVRQGQTLNNRTKEVQLPGLEAVSNKQVDEYKEWKDLQAPRVKQALADYALKAKKGEMEEFVTNAQRVYMDPNTPPALRTQMKMILDNTPEMYKLNALTESKQAIKATPTPRVGGGAGARGGGKPPPGPFDVIDKIKDPVQKFWTIQTFIARTDPEDPMYNQLVAMANATRGAALLAAEATSNKGRVIAPEGLPVQQPTVPAELAGGTASRVPVPGATPTPQKEAPKASLADVQKMYPGVPVDKLKEAYKRKFGVDLK